MKCGYELSRASLSFQSYLVRQYLTIASRVASLNPYVKLAPSRAGVRRRGIDSRSFRSSISCRRQEGEAWRGI